MTNYKFLSRRAIAESDKYPFTLSALNKMIYCAKENGLEKALFRIGRRIIIREDLFDEWLQSRK